MADNNLVNITFENHTEVNLAQSKLQKRPIFDDMEIIKMRFAGDTQKVATFPAHDVDTNATREAIANGTIHANDIITFAMAHPKEYMAFKSGAAQEAQGTPLSELGELTEGKRREYRAMNVHTVEALAAIDGQPLKNLGAGARAHKDIAIAYLADRRNAAPLSREDADALRDENARLRMQLDASRESLDVSGSTVRRKNKYQRDMEKAATTAMERIPPNSGPAEPKPALDESLLPTPGKTKTPAAQNEGDERGADDDTSQDDQAAEAETDEEEIDISKWTNDELIEYIVAQGEPRPAKRTSRAKLETIALKAAGEE